MVVKRQLRVQSHYSLVRRTLMQTQISYNVTDLITINTGARARYETHL